MVADYDLDPVMDGLSCISPDEMHEFKHIGLRPSVGKALWTTTLVLSAGFLAYSGSGFQFAWAVGLQVTITTACAIIADFLLLSPCLGTGQEETMTFKRFGAIGARTACRPTLPPDDVRHIAQQWDRISAY